MTVLQSTLDPNASAYDEAAATMSGKLDEINAELAKALAGGGPKYVDRHHARGKTGYPPMRWLEPKTRRSHSFSRA